jgi:hypothetical protein
MLTNALTAKIFALNETSRLLDEIDWLKDSGRSRHWINKYESEVGSRSVARK